MSQLLLAIAIGLAVGMIVGALGAGGGILSVPVLVYLLGQEPHAAAASSLVIVGSTALFSLPHHHRKRNVEWKQGTIFALLAILGSVAGSRISVLVDNKVLMGLFGTLLVAVGIFMLRKAFLERQAQRKQDQAEEPNGVNEVGQRRSWPVIFLAASFTGFLTGFFGVGGGFIVVPVLLFALAMPIRKASGTSLLIMIITALTGLAARYGTDISVDWFLTLCFTAGSIVGGILGGPLSARAKPWMLTTIFAVLLLGVSAFTLLNTFVFNLA